MFRLSFALLISVAAMLLITPKVLPVLHRLKFGQTIYHLGPESHQAKQGTPTMGGLTFAAVTVVLALLLHGAWFGINDFGLALIVFSLLNMGIGFVDDYIKVVKKRSLGLIWWQKVVGQVLFGGLFAWFCYQSPQIGSRIIIPFATRTWDLGVWYVPLMTLMSMFMVNSANLQDGLDGLLSSVAATGSAAWAGIALLAALAGGTLFVGAEAGNLANVTLFGLVLTGACIGFLRFNAYPAKVFMGDTGSMFIGGATVGMAMVLRLPIFMLLISFTMVASSASVILQRIYFKLTHGKRIFRMSPLHHHFELGGMTEPLVVALYTAVTAILSVVAALSINWFAQ
jgi:phospho-N-acetylmuramoyl-pentapeptide-transferase